MIDRSRALLLAMLAFAQACTLEAGHGFATIEGGALQMVLVPGRSRDAGGGVFLTDQGYRVRPIAMTLRVAQIRLLALRGAQGGASASFDPGNPPDGFTLCHGGHCHADDGSLVDYADVQAMLAGGSASFEPIATLPVDRTFDLLEGENRRLTEITPSAELPRGSIDRMEVALARFRLSAEVEGGALSEPVMLEIDLPLEHPVVHTLSLSIDGDGPEQIELAVDLELDATVLDGIDLSSLVEDGSLVVDGEELVETTVREWLASAEITTGF